jgi:hypothetical protein
MGSVFGAAQGIIKGTAETGGDLGEAAVATVSGAIKAAGETGADTAEAAKSAVGGVMDAATSVGGSAASTVRDALVSSAELPRDVVEAALNGSDKKS